MRMRDALRAQGRPARIEPAWVRPQWALPYAVLCAAGVAGSLLATSSPLAGLAVLVVVVVLLAGDASGRLMLLRLPLRRRATQNVVSEPVIVPPGARVRLIVTAPLDAPRTGLAQLAAPFAERLRGALGGRGPTPIGWLALSLLALALLAALRLAGADGDWIAPASLAPTVALVVGTFAFADLAFARPAAHADATAVGLALALVAALDRDPPRHLAVECVLAGASEPGQLGLRAYVRARRRGARPEELAVLALGGRPAPGGGAHHPGEGRALPARLDPQLVAHARAVGLAPARGRVTGALPARLARWPALGVSPDPADPEATLERLLALVRRLDGQLRR
ncbi:MAG TPA: hypothetical protein VFR97_13590 [Capillimicrobium sp.]|nr:hypothetical protein [Capillimicrobium sp.]